VINFILMDMSEVILNSVARKRKRSNHLCSTRDEDCENHILSRGGEEVSMHRLVL
jgi:hypothetical protein